VTNPAPSTAEIIFTLPDEPAMRAAALAAKAIAEGAEIYRTLSEPWQVKVRPGSVPAADWRGRLIALVEVLLPGEGPGSLTGHLDAIAELAERCANLHAATSLPLRPALHLEALTPALKEMAAQLRQIYVEASGENPWEDAPDA